MSDGFSNPIVGGGGALVYPSIHSPNYVLNSAGWSINKDGSGQLAGLTFSSLGISVFGLIAMNTIQFGSGANADVWYQPSGVTTGGTDLSHIQSLLNLGQAVNLMPGHYYLNGNLTIPANSSLRGAGRDLTFIHQVSTTADAIDFSAGPVTLADFTLVGPSSGTGHGIAGVANPLPLISVKNVKAQHFGSDGFNLGGIITSVLDGCEALLNGGNGFVLYSDGGPCTSVSFVGCYANGNTGTAGYNLSDVQYSSLSGCAADNNALGYLLSSCIGVALTGCGAESTTGTVQAKMTNGNNNVVNGMMFYQSKGTSMQLVAETFATLTGLEENTPSGATAFISTDAASSAVVINDKHTTANSFAAGTCYEILPTGATIH